MAKKNTPNLGYKNAPVRKDLTGYERIDRSDDNGRYGMENGEEDSPHRNEAQA